MSEQTQNRKIDEIERHYACQSFLNREAELLDDRQLEAWLELLTDDIQYDMPIRLTRERAADSEFSKTGYNYRETKRTLEARIERFQSDFAWSADPPSRTRRLVTNVQVIDTDEDEIHVKSNLLLWRNQGDTEKGTTLFSERQDVLRYVDDGLRLAERRILLDHTILPMKNLPIFL